MTMLVSAAVDDQDLAIVVWDPPADPADSVVAGVAEVVERGRRVAPASPAVDRLTGDHTSLAGRPSVI